MAVLGVVEGVARRREGRGALRPWGRLQVRAWGDLEGRGGGFDGGVTVFYCGGFVGSVACSIVVSRLYVCLALVTGVLACLGGGGGPLLEEGGDVFTPGEFIGPGMASIWGMLVYLFWL
ncbi:hypothetical protein M758_5G163100 [Ceratodon purpureus]|nr:hypothetical protein M758_5G163100 [Ceratodon purpureus]